MIDEVTCRERVARGKQLLDIRVPDWRDRTPGYEFNSVTDCIACRAADRECYSGALEILQIRTAHEGVLHGFDTVTEDWEERGELYELMTKLWDEAIASPPETVCPKT